MSWGVLPSGYPAVLDGVAAVVVIALCISSVDDLFIFTWYWTQRAWRVLTRRQDAALTPAQLHGKGEQPMAIMVPAWLEHEVIAAMIQNMLDVLDYRNYHVFIGTCASDARTGIEVDRLCMRYPHVHRAEVPHDAPASRADCLNAIAHAVHTHEQHHGVEFAGVVLHGSEDVLHPLELKFFNYLLPRKDVIQLPVTSLERRWNELVAGTGMDELAERLATDLALRESVSGAVPSAGVGTCISRRAMQALVVSTSNRPFNSNSLAWDCDAGTRLAQLGFHSMYAVLPVSFRVERKGCRSGEPAPEITVSMPLCVRQLFPDSFRQAYRRKARWLLGACMQSWQQVRWQASLAARYLLLRDTKHMVMAVFNALACVLVAQYALVHLSHGAAGLPAANASRLAANSGWRMLLWFIASALLIRCAHRIYFTTRLYGWEHGLIALPRMAVSCLVNLMAVARAWRLTLDWALRSTDMARVGSVPRAPTGTQLKHQRKRLGELLHYWQAVDTSMLDKALKEQAQTHAPLGRILVSNGWLDEETLAEAIAYQAGLPRAQLSAAVVLEHAGHVAPDFGTRYRAVYIGMDEHERPLLAMASALPDAALDELGAWFGVRPRQHIVRESEISIALRLLSGTSGSFSALGKGNAGVPLLGDMLIEQGLLKRKVFEEAMETYRPDRHGRVGDYLVRCEVIRRDVIERVVAQQKLMHAALSRAAPRD